MVVRGGVLARHEARDYDEIPRESPSAQLGLIEKRNSESSILDSTIKIRFNHDNTYDVRS